nr:hypothetical protein [Stenotrophomonas pavanii]
MQFSIRPTAIKPLHVLGALVAFIAFAYFVGGFAGQKDPGVAVRERLTLVWPDLMMLSEEDRKLLAFLATDCGLADVVAEKAQTIRCLRRSAVDPLREVPPGRNGLPGAVALEVLISEAERVRQPDGETQF